MKHSMFLLNYSFEVWHTVEQDEIRVTKSDVPNIVIWFVAPMEMSGRDLEMWAHGFVAGQSKGWGELLK